MTKIKSAPQLPQLRNLRKLRFAHLIALCPPLVGCRGTAHCAITHVRVQLRNTFNFCDYFSKIGLKLASKISSHDDNAFKTYLGKSLFSSLFLCPTTYFEVLQEINSLKNKKSCGYDNIPVYSFKVAAKVLATPLSILFNYSFRYGIFPDCLKTAKVVPIFKKGNKNEINNYRPISLLSTFSKILEKLICKRMRKFLDKHSIVSVNQYGLRYSLSTTHAMLDVLTSTYDNINDNTITA